MREIKFRAWDNNSKIMISDQITIQANGTFTVIDKYNESVEAYNGDDIGSQFFLMQYTGLKDKNGVEIYEGDVLRWHDENLEVIWGKVGWDLSSSLFKYPHQGWNKKPSCYEVNTTGYTTKSKVIGNIHENPGLLTKEGSK